AWRQLNRPAVRRRHRTPARAPCSGIAARGRVATGDATTQRRAVAVCGGLLLLLVGRELLLDIVGIETQYLRRCGDVALRPEPRVRHREPVVAPPDVNLDF